MIEFFKNVTGLKGATKMECLLGFVGGFIIPFVSISMIILKSILFPEVIVEGIETNPSEIVEILSMPFMIAAFVGFTVAIIIPVAEELIFRGILWYGFSFLTERSWLLILFTSGIFIMAHGNLEHMIGVTPLAFFMGWLRYKSDSIIPTIIAHMTNNTLVVVFVAILMGVSNVS
jgi:membrane protease YdiL (CAAX protease family)